MSFGIKDVADAREVCEHGADGVIIGSHFMKLLKTEGIINTEGYIKKLQIALK